MGEIELPSEGGRKIPQITGTEEIELPPEGAREILEVLSRYGVQGHLVSIAVSPVPVPPPEGNRLIWRLFFYEVDNVCLAFRRRQNLPACNIP